MIIGVHGAFEDKDKSVNLAHQSLDRSESQVERLTQQNSRLEGNIFSQDSSDFKDPYLASRAFSGHSHVSVDHSTSMRSDQLHSFGNLCGGDSLVSTPKHYPKVR